MIGQLSEEFRAVELAANVGDGSVEVMPTHEQTTAAVLRMGYVRIGQNELRDLGLIGAYVRASGVLRVSRGRAMVLQQRLNTAMEALTARRHVPRP